MIQFLIFLVIMSVTPGPNTILAMSAGAEQGFKKTLPYQLGIGIGVFVIALIAMVFGELIKDNHLLMTLMKLVGTGYLLYLAYHVLKSQQLSDGTHQAVTLKTGLLLQFTNVKVYLYAVTGLTGFDVMHDFTFGKILLMVVIGVVGTLMWAAFGHGLKDVYNRHFTGINRVIAVLLVFSALDLWR
ncbi:LysE family transporter [Lactococcus insecticola]|uniref:Amino acid transporter LysE n=1 Tax=Pseudolactococcus insecticola TaxID=2709158 RepID=A0A6A0B9N9_9LACT|nr:LysE family transporter [Lactococcus insecticola]GFH41333.1 amino acid transporter LysE [Lactococcus insecticola]